MMKPMGIIFLIFCLGQNPSAYAELPPLVKLEHCFQHALSNNETLKLQEQQVEQAHEHLWQSRAGFSPILNGSSAWQWQQDPPAGLASSFSPSTQTTVKASASLNLFHGLRDFGSLRTRGAEKRGAEAGLRQAKFQLYQDVAQAYYTVIADRFDLDGFQKEIAANQKRRDELMSLKRLARARESDIVSLDSAVASLEAAVVATQIALQNAHETLAFLTGMPGENLSNLDENLSLPKTGDLLDVKDWLSKTEDRADITQAREIADAADLAVWNQRGAHLPSVDLGGNYYFTRPGFLSTVTWDVQLSVTLPIFSGGATQSQVRELASVRSAREISLTQLRRSANKEIQTSWQTVKLDLTQLEKLEKAATLSEQKYNLYLKDNKQGLVSNLDVLQALAAMYQTKRTFDHSRYSTMIDWIKLQTQTQGVPL